MRARRFVPQEAFKQFKDTEDWRKDQNIDDFPHLKRWLETMRERPATVRAYAMAKEINPNFGQPVNRTEEERRVLFGQTAAVVK